MSGAGAPKLDQIDGTGLKIAVIAAQWHREVMDGLVAGAQRALAAAGVADAPLIRVPGAFELPVAALHAAEGSCDAVVALGVVIRGDTPHFDYVCQGATSGLTQVSLSTKKPVGFGLLTVDTEEQALARAGLAGSAEDKGAEAVEAVLATLQAIRLIHQP